MIPPVEPPSPSPAFEHAGRIAGPAPDAVVAIPVRNEAERIGACLAALGAQRGVPVDRYGIVLLLNDCRDGTADVVARALPALPCRIRVIEADLERPTAGRARRAALEAAASWLGEDHGSGVLLTTDADSRVPPDWIARNLAAVASGADAVAGRIALDPDEAALLPAALHERGRREGRYEALLAEIAARMDPDPYDPWPHHWTASGATLAVTLAAYRACGGMPDVALGEDKAFVAALRRIDARLRHDPGIRVVTSGRLVGRAPGGAADTMRLRCERHDSPCDALLEPLPHAVRRFRWRRRIRVLHRSRRLAADATWVDRLSLPKAAAMAAAGSPAFGAAWETIEAASPLLARHPLSPGDLPGQIRLAELVRGSLRLREGLCPRDRPARARGRGGIAAFAPAGSPEANAASPR